MSESHPEDPKNNDENSIITDVNDNKLKIVDLDPVSTKTYSRSKAVSHKYLVPLIRLAMTFLTLLGSIVLLTLYWPTISHSLGWTTHSRSTPTPTPMPKSFIAPPQTFSDVLSDGTVLYIYTIKYTNNIGRGVLDAFHENNGVLFWHYNGIITGSPRLVDGVIYIPSTSGIDALCARDRSLLWHSHSTMHIEDIDNGILYTMSSLDQGHHIALIRAKDGAELWSRNDVDYLALPASNSMLYVTSPVESSNVAGKPTLFALHMIDGSELWHYTPSIYVTRSDVRVEGDTVCISFHYTDANGKQVKNIVVLNARSGATLWNKNIDGNFENLVNGVLYFTEDSGGITAVRASDGTQLWNYKNGQDTFSLQFLGDNLYAISLNMPKNPTATQPGSGTLYALRPSDGMLLWQAHTSENTITIISVQDDIVYIQDSSTKFDESNVSNVEFIALRVKDGQAIWQKTVPVPMVNNNNYLWCFIDNGLIYCEKILNSDESNKLDGIVYALKISDGTQIWNKRIAANVIPATNGITYLASASDGTVIAVRNTDGSVLWRYQPLLLTPYWLWN